MKKFDIDKYKIINTVNRNASRIKTGTFFICFALFVVYTFSMIMYLTGDYTYRKTFMFEGLDKKALYVESRYFPRVKNVDKIQLYVEELVLGPIGNRYKNLFEPGTKVVSCFVRGRDLYVELSRDALFPSVTTSNFDDSVRIFEKNILRNFPKISKIHLYIEGKKVGEF